MVMDMGTLDYSVWALDLADLLRGRFPEAGRIAHASNSVTAEVSPDGGRVLIRRVVPTVGQHTERRYSVAAFSGVGETPLAVAGTVLDVSWVDSVTVAVATKSAGAAHLALTDVGTGAQRAGADVPDTTIRVVAGWPGGWAWIPASGDRIVVLEGGRTREIKQPAWYASIYQVAADPAGRRITFAGFNAANNDTLGIGVFTVADGAVTQWASVHADEGSAWFLPDQSLMVEVWESEESPVLFRAPAPGRLVRVGGSKRPLLGITLSGDLKRATAIERAYQADAWMYEVVRY
jgi:hypothetical protein